MASDPPSAQSEPDTHADVEITQFETRVRLIFCAVEVLNSLLDQPARLADDMAMGGEGVIKA